MKRILKALGKTLGFLGIAIVIGLTPIVSTYLLGPVGGLVVVIGLLTSYLFYIIYKFEK